MTNGVTQRRGVRASAPVYLALLLALAIRATAQNPPATPSPTPAPVAEKPVADPEAQPSREAFLPPLSLDDALELTRRAEALLAQPGAAQRETPRRMIELARDYVDLLDERHSSLGSYEWFKVAEVEPPATGLETKTVQTVQLPIQVDRVSALSFRSLGGEVVLWSIRVVDVGGNDVPLDQERPVRILRELPRAVIRYLGEPTRIATIETRCGSPDGAELLAIYAGVTLQPELAKKALYQFADALDALPSRRPGGPRTELSDAELLAIRSSLKQASADMIAFKRHIERKRPREGLLSVRPQRKGDK